MLLLLLLVLLLVLTANCPCLPAGLRAAENDRLTRGPCMQVVLSLGIVVAQAINIGTQHIYPNGWRISLALAGAAWPLSACSRGCK